MVNGGGGKEGVYPALRRTVLRRRRLEERIVRDIGLGARGKRKKGRNRIPQRTLGFDGKMN